MTNQATLVGKRMNESLLADLKVLLAMKPVELFEGQPLEILEVTATVNGTSSSDAYLSVELLLKGHEWSPCILEFPLEGSSKLEANDKSYVKYVSGPYMRSDRAIHIFFRSYAKTLAYRGNGMAAWDCVKSDVQPETNQATLVGKPLYYRFLNYLKYLFESHTSFEQPLVLLEATATVNGTAPSDAYLSVELLIKGHDWSPCILEFPLKGSSKLEASDKRYDKILSDYSSCDYAIRTFFRACASVLEYRGNGMAPEDCMVSDWPPSN